MNNVNLVSLRDISINCAEKLSKMLSNDRKLKKALGICNCNVEGTDFIIQNKTWEMKHRGEVFIISLKSQPIGIISLSNKENNEEGRVGYWIGSEYWGKGYTTEAFSKIVEYAKVKGNREISACIPKENIFSKRIWERYNAHFINEECRYIVTLKL